MPSRQLQREEWACGCVSRRQVRTLYRVLWGANALLILSNLALAAGWRPPIDTLGTQLNMDNEEVIGAWYPSVLLLLLGLAALGHYLRALNIPGDPGRPSPSGWLLLSALAVWLSADEVACLHENIEKATAARVGEQVLGLDANWTLLLAPVIAAVLGLLVLFCRRAFAGTRRPRRLATAAVACWATAVLLEFVEHSLLAGSRTALLWRTFEQPLEESLELVGTTLFLMALVELALEKGKRDATGPVAWS